MLVDSPTLITY